ncbi:MAG: cupredoxin domain-containing protein [Rhodospirillales bacterium]|nr:cupredoxin domain-containing protein [Rhodospirillales bacterium]
MRTAFALLAAFGLAACAATGDTVVSTEGGYDIQSRSGTVNSVSVVEEADWENAWTRTLRIRQGEFTPSLMVFRAGIPYVLTFENGDDIAHTFVASDFFKAVAVKSVVPSVEEIASGSKLVSLHLEPGESRKMSFVAVRDGYYYFRKGPTYKIDTVHFSPFGVGKGGAIFIE